MHDSCSVMSDSRLSLLQREREPCQASLSMEFSGQEYWSELPFPPPGDLPDLGLNRRLLHPPYWQQESFTSEPLGKSQLIAYTQLYYIYLNFC